MASNPARKGSYCQFSRKNCVNWPKGAFPSIVSTCYLREKLGFCKFLWVDLDRFRNVLLFHLLYRLAICSKVCFQKHQKTCFLHPGFPAITQSIKILEKWGYNIIDRNPPESCKTLAKDWKSLQGRMKLGRKVLVVLQTPRGTSSDSNRGLNR